MTSEKVANKKLLVFWKDEKEKIGWLGYAPYNIRVQSQVELDSFIRLHGDEYCTIYCTGNMPLYIKNVHNMVKV